MIRLSSSGSSAAEIIDSSNERHLSIYSYMELLQAAKNKQQHHYTMDFLSSLGFIVLPLSETIGHRALIYLEEYAFSHGLRAGDAIIAATAVENRMTLVSSNTKHFKPVKELKFKAFKP